ncbi:MAG: nitroreductase family protein [Mailhella sp.]|nr:nitroreductase family protein [Mailhella sp.]
MQTFFELISQARSCRRFDPSRLVTEEELRSLAEAAMLSPSARNAQVLRYALVSEPAEAEGLYRHLVLGGAYSAEERGALSYRPAAFIMILGPANPSKFTMMDVGIAAQSLNLAANSMGLKACMCGAFDERYACDFIRSKGIADLVPSLLLAVGSPAENTAWEVFSGEGKPTYRREPEGQIVQKLPLDTLIVYPARQS